MRRRYSKQTIGVLGLSYCGSTVLNYVLDTHPDIYGGSELYRLFANDKLPQCAICGRQCRYWTCNALDSVRDGGRGAFYANIASLMGARVICDSSKQPGHFIKIMRHDLETSFVFILLTKHPIRHVASFIANDYLKQRNRFTLPEIMNLQQLEQERSVEVAREYTAKILAFARQMEDRIPLFEARGTVLRMQYEEIIATLQGTLDPLLHLVGLEYVDAMSDFSRHEHHPIGGNMGPHLQTTGRQGAKLAYGRMSESRERFYTQSQSLVIDNKYREILSVRLLDALCASAEIVEACHLLGYKVSPEE
jgi:hypothetical protein